MEWLSEEWSMNEKCIKCTKDEATCYQFCQHRAELITLCAHWQTSLTGISVGDNQPPSWGPADEDLLAAHIDFNVDKVTHIDVDDDTSDNEVDEDDVNPTYFAALDAVNMADAFHTDTGIEDLGISVDMLMNDQSAP
ncbi:hypothetical protein BDN71DRAFT_1427568 [Pleurotus eryngii]|uniref:Uncharacterized protein n=1 Tax=Pleurotus eryngii TaxID=5323 RepID=A0A9P6DJD4_PLEER|nr:hypothetical protein BDN71DRAFT_1427568 [Pleurotus eryngii]